MEYYTPKVIKKIQAFLFDGSSDSIPDELNYYKNSSGQMMMAQGSDSCSKCGRPRYLHSIVLPNNQVCPNTYVVVENDRVINLIDKESFESIYKKIEIRDINYEEVK